MVSADLSLSPLPNTPIGGPLSSDGGGRLEVWPGAPLPKRGGKLQRKTRVWNSSPPPPAGCLPRRNYFGLSSLVQPPQGGRLSRGREIHFRGRGLRAPGGRGQASLGSSSTFRGCSAGRGRGGRGCVTPAWRTPQQAHRASLGCARVLWGRPWARRGPGPLVSGPRGSDPAGRTPTSGGLSTAAPGPVRLPPAPRSGTHLGLVTHTWRWCSVSRVAGQAGP